MVKIHMIPGTVPDQRVVEHYPSVIFNDFSERMVNGWLDDHRVTFPGKMQQCQTYAFDYT